MTRKPLGEEARQGPSFPGDAHLLEGSPERRRLLELAESEDRRTALLADPGLVALCESGEEFSDQEVQDLKRSVVLARRLREVETGARESISNRLSGWAVALSLGLLFLLPSSFRHASDTLPTVPSLGAQSIPVAMTHSSVEAFGLPGARVYELADEDFSLVLVVDESFEL